METPPARPRLLAGAAADLEARSPPGAARAVAPDAALDIALDIALDEALVARAEHVVRAWRPRGCAAVLGVASEAASELLLDACRADELPVLRRSTGGAAVLLTPEVACFSMIMPHALHPEARRISGAYGIAFAGLARALGELGLDAVFERPGDVAVSGRKLVGLAQARRRRATLVHGVVPVGIDRAMLGRYLAHPPAEPAYRSGRPHAEFVTTIARETGAPARACDRTHADRRNDEELMRRTLATLGCGLAGEDAEALAPACLDEILDEARGLAAGKYGRKEWTFRR